MDWKGVIASLAPTVASALGGPLVGNAVAELGSLFGFEAGQATIENIKTSIENGKMTPDQISAIKQMELTYQDHEKERQFKYSELQFKDRDSARQANVQGGTQVMIFWLSVLLLVVTIGAEITVLFKGLPVEAPDMVVGRVLGLMDAVATMVLAYWFGASHGDSQKTDWLAKSPAIK